MGKNAKLACKRDCDHDVILCPELLVVWLSEDERKEKLHWFHNVQRFGCYFDHITLMTSPPVLNFTLLCVTFF